MAENHDREGARHSVFTEIEEVNSLDADFDPYHLSHHAFHLTDVLSGFVDRNAIGGVRGAWR